MPAAEPAKPVRPTPALFGKVQVAAPAEPAEPPAEEENQAGEKPLDASELPATPAESAAPAELTVPTELAIPAEVPAESLAEDESAGARIHPQQVREMHENFAERSRPIVLIGPMAAGKTYIGTHLAREASSCRRTYTSRGTVICLADIIFPPRWCFLPELLYLLPALPGCC